MTFTVANNFWGKDDAGVGPMLERMHNAKVTCDELKAFYNGMISSTKQLCAGSDVAKQFARPSKTSMRESLCPYVASLWDPANRAACAHRLISYVEKQRQLQSHTLQSLLR